MENKFEIPQKTKDVIELLPLLEQLSYWQTQYEHAMQSLQVILEDDLGKVFITEKIKY